MATILRFRALVDAGEIARDLESVELGLGRELTAVRREAAGIIASRASRISTRTPGRITGELAGSLAGRAAGVVSTVPQGPVHEFGGTIAPRGTPIRIKRSAFTEQAGERERERVERLLETRIDALVGRHL